MIIWIAIALIVAKIKGYKIKSAFTAHVLYPIYIVELVYCFFQFNAFFGNYAFVKDPYPSILQKLALLALLPPILYYKLYKPAIVGSFLTILGTALNRIVISANGGFMPVYPTLSKITGYYKEGMLEQGLDNLHIMLTSETKLNILADYIDVGWSIMSIGDLLIHSFTSIIIYSAVVAINTQIHQKIKEVGEQSAIR
ncbi:MAG: DUF5317 domain-containing protein [Clostridiales bacterium]|nr:DUF5317 domain-containing protein [Clostridiales bacterium]